METGESVYHSVELYVVGTIHGYSKKFGIIAHHPPWSPNITSRTRKKKEHNINV